MAAGLSVAQLLTQVGAFQQDPFCLVDVGCSGGLVEAASHFSPHLRAVGFDPLISEVERLRATAPRGEVAFEAALVGAGDRSHPAHRRTRGVFQRSSAALYANLHSFDHIKEFFNAGAPVLQTERTVRLDEWLRSKPQWKVDFLKTDTDGYDLSVLRSLGARLGEPLAIQVEVALDGDPDPDSNLISTVFDLVCGEGFRLFSLEPTCYSKAAMPQPFVWEMPAQTTTGQVLQADMLFCRDLAVEGSVEPIRLLKMACIFDLMDLQDCAAELIESRWSDIDPVCPVSREVLMAALADRTTLGLTPEEAQNTLRQDPKALFPHRSASGELIPAGRTGGPEALIAHSGQSEMTVPVLAADGAPIAFGTAPGRTIAGLRQGWSSPEDDGVWTTEPHAVLDIDVASPAKEGSIIEVTSWQLAADEDGTVRALSIDGVLLTPLTASPSAMRFRVDERLHPGRMAMVFYAWPLRRPSDTMDSSDERTLGIRVSEIRLLSGDHTGKRTGGDSPRVPGARP